MKEDLIRHHKEELARAKEGFTGWDRPADEYADEKCCSEHRETFREAIGFHERAIAWLESL